MTKELTPEQQAIKYEKNKEWRWKNRALIAQKARERYRRVQAAKGKTVNPRASESATKAAATRTAMGTGRGGRPHKFYVSGANHAPKLEPRSVDAVLNYCPSCGANIRKIETALRGGVYV